MPRQETLCAAGGVLWGVLAGHAFATSHTLFGIIALKAGGTITERDMSRLITRLEEIQSLASSKR